MSCRIETFEFRGVVDFHGTSEIDGRRKPHSDGGIRNEMLIPAAVLRGVDIDLAILEREAHSDGIGVLGLGLEFQRDPNASRLALASP